MNWRLITDLIAFFPTTSGTKTVYFAAPGKKSYKAAVIKEIFDSYTETYLEMNEFDLKISDTNLNLYVRGDMLPDKTAWYLVGNPWDKAASLIFLNTVSKRGEFEEKFEAVFSEDHPSKVAFVSDKMEFYGECLEEMKRRLNCELHFKTNKFQVGHRYDTVKESYYYLGNGYSRKKDNRDSDLLDSGVPIHFTVSELWPNEKSVSDVFNNRLIGTGKGDIHVFHSLSPMVDCGEVLTPDYAGYESYLPAILQNTIAANRKVNNYGYVWYKSMKQILDSFCYYSQTSDFPKLIGGKDVKDILSPVLEYSMFSCLLKNWEADIYRADLQLGKKVSPENNIRALAKNYISLGFTDENISRTNYYNKLFSGLGIDIEEISSIVFNNWDEGIIYQSFDNYMKFFPYTEREQNRYVINQRSKSVRFSSGKEKDDDDATVKSFFGDTSVLASAIYGLFEKAKKNFGIGVDTFNIYNVGTKNKPNEYIVCKMSIENLLNFKKGDPEAIEILKDEILRYKFVQLYLTIDKDGELV